MRKTVRACIICYLIAGGLAGVAGVFDAAYTGTVLPELGLSTISAVNRTGTDSDPGDAGARPGQRVAGGPGSGFRL